MRFGVSPVAFRKVRTLASKIESRSESHSDTEPLPESPTQLLHHPIGRRLSCDVEVQDPAAAVLDHKKTLQHPERRRGHREKIERDNGLAVVAKKRQPLLDRITPALNALQIPCDGPFRHGEAELLKLAVDLRRAPIGIPVRQSPNQDADFLSDPRPAAARPGLPNASTGGTRRDATGPRSLASR